MMKKEVARLSREPILSKVNLRRKRSQRKRRLRNLAKLQLKKVEEGVSLLVEMQIGHLLPKLERRKLHKRFGQAEIPSINHRQFNVSNKRKDQHQ